MAQIGNEKMSGKSLPSRERFPELFREGPCVDRSGCARTTPMKVLCFGLPRTGTACIYARSPRQFGRLPGPPHGRRYLQPDDAQRFIRANNARNHPSESPPFTKAHWDQLLGDCQGTIDAPTAFFADELITAYPDAKVVLIQRDFDAWYKSMSQTALKTLNLDLFGRLILWLDYREAGQAIHVVQDLLNTFLGPEGDQYDNAKRRYNSYFEHIRQIVPKKRLLEFNMKGGYGPLCEFLGCDVPMERDSETGKESVKSFPHINETSDFQELAKLLFQVAITRSLKNYVAKPLALIAVLVAGRGIWARLH